MRNLKMFLIRIWRKVNYFKLFFAFHSWCGVWSECLHDSVSGCSNVVCHSMDFHYLEVDDRILSFVTQKAF